MPVTKAISSKANAKQTTNADSPINPNQLVTSTYSSISAAGQSIINLSFAVSQSNIANFFLYVDGKLLTLGSSADYTFTSIQATTNTSSTITLASSLSANLNIQAFYLGVILPNYSLTNLTASVNTVSAQLPRNQLINSAFDFWQRGTSTTIANGATTYLADRWYVKNSLGTSGVITNSQTTGSVTGSKFGCSVQISTAPTASQANGTELYQTLENLNTLPLLNQSLSLSVNVKALGNVNQVGLQFFYNTSEAKVATSLGAEQVVSVTSGSFTLGSLTNISVGTTPTNSGVIGVRIRIVGVSTGNTYDLNNGFVVEQAMMNIGSTVGNFQRSGRNSQAELAMCQRYYEKSYDVATSPGTATSIGVFAFGVTGLTSTTNSFYTTAFFKQTKRINSGTVTLYSESGSSGKLRDVNASTDITGNIISSGSSEVFVNATVSAASTSIYVRGHYSVDSEI